MQLVERRRLRLARATPFEQEHAQLFAPAEAAQLGEALTGEQPPGGRLRVDPIRLAAAALTARRPLALVELCPAGRQVAGEAGAVAARALEREGRLAERGAQRQSAW